MACPVCSKGNNVYAKQCQHCGAALTPASTPGPPTHPHPVRGPCAKCGHPEFLGVESLGIRSPRGAQFGVLPLNVVCVANADGSDITEAGPFTAFVCLGCGHTEWYATDLARLAKLAAELPNAQLIRVPTPQPYRG